ncbi:MAG: DCC1-like thiol-disulfide oxidoreductase family protein [Marinagarivorans sp.]|nr:DCC1-like thiol-disulfide oxidoreductase family protein [Marinagarivorans sp.]
MTPVARYVAARLASCGGWTGVGGLLLLMRLTTGTTCPIDRAEILARFHAMEDGRLLSGAAAFAAMWRAIPVLWPLGQMARLPWVARGLEWAYLRFLRVRPRLQRFFK